MTKGEKKEALVEEASADATEKVDKDKFAQLAESLREISEAEEVDEATLNKLTDTFNSLNDATKKAFLDTEEAQEAFVRVAEETTGEPGSVVKRGPMNVKVPWKRADLDKFPTVEYTADKNEKYIWNGLRYEFLEGVPATVPQPVKQFIDQWKTDQRTMRMKNKTLQTSEGDVKFLQYGWEGKEAAVTQGEKD